MLHYFEAEGRCRGERSIGRDWRRRAAVQLRYLGGPGSANQSFGLINTDINWRLESFELGHTVR